MFLVSRMVPGEPATAAPTLVIRAAWTHDAPETWETFVTQMKQYIDSAIYSAKDRTAQPRQRIIQKLADDPEVDGLAIQELTDHPVSDRTRQATSSCNLAASPTDPLYRSSLQTAHCAVAA